MISSIEHKGMEAIAPYLLPGRTVALLGSSGSGKSTLINELVGAEKQKVNLVREGDDRGKHTTTHREMILLPQGGIIIDTPGMRELQLWHGEEGIHGAFDDIDSLAQHCFYKDCQHRNEPRCAVKTALKDRTLDHGRYENYKKLLRELAHLEAKEGQKSKLLDKQTQRKSTQKQNIDED